MTISIADSLCTQIPDARPDKHSSWRGERGQALRADCREFTITPSITVGHYQGKLS
jgi:hypothetical protein